MAYLKNHQYFNFVQDEYKKLSASEKKKGFFDFEQSNYKELFDNFAGSVEKDLWNYMKFQQHQFYRGVHQQFSLDYIKPFFNEDGSLNEESLTKFELKKDSFASFSYHDKLVNYTIYNLFAGEEKMVMEHA